MTKQNFYRYLKEKGVYRSCLNYIKARLENPDFDEFYTMKFNNNIYNFIDYFIRLGSAHEIIMEGFTWASTREGEQFWVDVYNELRKKEHGY